MQILVRESSAAETIALRSLVLRPGHPIEESHFPCDAMAVTFHLVAESSGPILGCATLHPENHPLAQEELSPWRLRGMAVHPEAQGLGIGRRLLEKAEVLLREKGATLLWFNARESAFGFYSRLGYSIRSEMFDIPGVGPHKVMAKKLTAP